jgi:hypothetical protein
MGVSDLDSRFASSSRRLRNERLAFFLLREVADLTGWVNTTPRIDEEGYEHTSWRKALSALIILWNAMKSVYGIGFRALDHKCERNDGLTEPVEIVSRRRRATLSSWAFPSSQWIKTGAVNIGKSSDQSVDIFDFNIKATTRLDCECSSNAMTLII